MGVGSVTVQAPPYGPYCLLEEYEYACTVMMSHAGRNRSTPAGKLPFSTKMGPDCGENCGGAETGWRRGSLDSLRLNEVLVT